LGYAGHMVSRRVWLIGLICTLLWAQPKTETGEINGAKFRIDVPQAWNGGLVLYCHGYSPKPVSYDSPKPNPVLDVFLQAGYAVAQSGYAAGGWAIEEAVQDTEALRRYFAAKYGRPKETYVTGHSMGGFLTLALVEMFPAIYDGGLALCAAAAPSVVLMSRRVFDLRVVFDYFFPGALPGPVKVPADYVMSPALTEDILKRLEANPEKAAEVRRYSGIRSNKELAGAMVFFTYILKEIQERAGGNPFDNRNVLYEGTSDDNALNDGVSRYEADPRAAEYLRNYYTLTGKLTRPVLAIQTTYDPLIPAWVTNTYTTLAEMNGGAAWFVQQYVKRDGHCAILPAEVGRGFEQLRQWKQAGKRPAAGQNR
jgi:pimeloyl-ACP methyl ester carboxylesterase